MRVTITNDQLVEGRIPPELLSGLGQITELDLSYCADLERLPEGLPDSIEFLYLAGCIRLEDLSGLPARLFELNCTGCTGLRRILEFDLPASLFKLYLEDCLSLESLSARSAVNLFALNLTNCRGLEFLNLPALINNLNLTNCATLRVLSIGPNFLPRILDREPHLQDLLRAATNPDTTVAQRQNATRNLTQQLRRGITRTGDDASPAFSLPSSEAIAARNQDRSLSEAIEDRDPRRVMELLNSGPAEIIQQIINIQAPSVFPYFRTDNLPLQFIRLSLFQLSRSSPFNPNYQSAEDKKQADDTMKILTNAIESYNKAYKTENPGLEIPALPKFRKTADLVKRYLKDELPVRGGIKAVVSVIAPILKILQENPHLLPLTEIIAEEYLEACINQPVAGLLQIAAAIAIAMAPTITDKIAATKYWRVLEGIKLYIARLPKDQKPGELFEAEATNVLLREVHNKLFEEGLIKEPWLGVPESIAFGGGGRITPEKIDEACAMAREIVSEKDYIKILSYLCEAHNKIWGQIFCPQKVAEIKAEYEKLMEDLEAESKDEGVLAESKDEGVLADTESDKKSITELGYERATKLATTVRELSFKAFYDEIELTFKTLHEVLHKVLYEETESSFKALHEATNGRSVAANLEAEAPDTATRVRSGSSISDSSLEGPFQGK